MDVQPIAASPEGLRPWNAIVSMPFTNAAGRTEKRIDWPDNRTCSAVRLLSASKAPVNLHCVTG